MSKCDRLPALLVAALMLAAGPLAAQQSTTRGFSLGVQLQGASLSVEDGDADNGGGLGLKLGYGINRIVTLYVALDGAQVTAENAPNLTGEWSMAHVDFGARFHFANSLRRWVPYLEAAIGSRVVGVDEAQVDGQDVPDTNFNGAAFTVGGGLSVYVKQSFALDAGLRVSGGEFTEVEVGQVSVGGLNIDATSTRLGVGVVWWP
ncbi:MAG: outer membrane beta-barrel protein [Gemmatimonadota bacterium]